MVALGVLVAVKGSMFLSQNMKKQGVLWCVLHVVMLRSTIVRGPTPARQHRMRHRIGVCHLALVIAPAAAVAEGARILQMMRSLTAPYVLAADASRKAVRRTNASSATLPWMIGKILALLAGCPCQWLCECRACSSILPKTTDIEEESDLRAQIVYFKSLSDLTESLK